MNACGDCCHCFPGSVYTMQEKGQFKSSVGCGLDVLVRSKTSLALLQNIRCLFYVIESILCLQLYSVLCFWFSALEVDVPWKGAGRLMAGLSGESIAFVGPTFLVGHWMQMEGAWLFRKLQITSLWISCSFYATPYQAPKMTLTITSETLTQGGNHLHFALS